MIAAIVASISGEEGFALTAIFSAVPPAGSLIFTEFNVNVPAINKHIRNIISENELEESSTISKMEIVRYEGNMND